MLLSNLNFIYAFEKALKINDLRRCYEKDLDDSEKDMMEKFRNQVEIEYLMQESYVSGYDKENRAILMKMHRTSPDSMSKNHLIHTIYLLERAMACTELQSEGKQEQVFSICDFAKYARATVPAKGESKPTIQALQDHYPERLLHHVVVWVDGGGLARILLKSIWAVVKWFLDSKTRTKVEFIFNAVSTKSLILFFD